MLETFASIAPYLVWFGSLMISGSLLWSNRRQRLMLNEHVGAFSEYTRALNEVLTEKREELRRVNTNVEKTQISIDALAARLDARMDSITSAAKKHAEDDGSKLGAVEERMASFERGLDTFQGKINEVVERFNRSNQQIAALISRMTDAETVQEEHTKSFQDVREAIAARPDADDAAQQQIDALNEKFEALSNQLHTLRGAQGIVESELAKIAAWSGSWASAADHQALHRYVRELAEHVNAAVAQAGARFESVEADINQFSEGFNQQAERLNGIEHESDVMRRRVGEVNGRITDFDTALSELRERVGTLRDEFDEVDDTVEQIDGDLANVEATVKAQTTLIGTHDNALRMNDARVTQALNDLQAVANREPEAVNALGQRIEQIAQELGMAVDRLDERLQHAIAARSNGHAATQEPLGAQ